MQDLKDLRKAYRRALRGHPEGVVAAERSLRNLGATLNRPTVAMALDKMITTARAESLQEQRAEDQRVYADTEIRLLERLKLKSHERNLVRDLVTRGTVSADFPRSSGEVFDLIARGHREYLKELDAAKRQSKTDKKETKSRILRGVCTLTLGAGAIVANAHFPPTWVASYGVGGGALMNGVRDLIPER